MVSQRNGRMLRRPQKPVRYAVVGLGHIAQNAVLPAFAHARRNSRLVALVSGDGKKLRAMGKEYGVEQLYSYDEYDACLASGEVDAVFIALPNHLHCEYTVRAAQQGVHVLCEKPMAVTESECLQMIQAATDHHVRLMIAYRLHFERANLQAVKIAQSGKLGELRIFDSTFSMQVKPGNIRIDREKGGGTIYDIGIYCLNAARYLFRAEPTEVFARAVSGTDRRFREVDEMTSVIMHFPGERLATFTSSFGAADVDYYRLVGSQGDLRMEPAYGYTDSLGYTLTVKNKHRTRSFAPRDQFAAELLYFSDCLVEGRAPEPSGTEGLADVRVIEAIYRSAAEGRPVAIEPTPKRKRPGPHQEIARRAVSSPKLVRVSAPHD